MPISPRPSDALRAATTLALWSAALSGGLDPDAVLTALRRTGVATGARADSDADAEYTALPGPGEPAAPLAAVLPLLRGGGRAQLVLPVPGDMRGLPPGSALAAHALDAGAAVVLPRAQVALVPHAGHWRAYRAPAAHRPLDEAQALSLLESGTREAAALLARADHEGSRSGRDRVSELIRHHRVDTPPGTPAGAAHLLDAAITVHCAVTVAREDGAGSATVRQLGAVTGALRPMADLARELRRSAVAQAVAALHPDKLSTAPAAADRISRPLAG